MAGPIASLSSDDALLQDDFSAHRSAKKGPPTKSKKPKGKKKKGKKKGGRDFRGIDRKTGIKDSGPGPVSAVRRAMTPAAPC